MLESPQRMLSGGLEQSVLWGRADSRRPGQCDRGEPVQELWWGLFVGREVWKQMLFCLLLAQMCGCDICDAQ